MLLPSYLNVAQYLCSVVASMADDPWPEGQRLPDLLPAAQERINDFLATVGDLFSCGTPQGHLVDANGLCYITALETLTQQTLPKDLTEGFELSCDELVFFISTR